MQNITSTHLEAALIDQHVAGHFHGKSYAFSAVYNDGPALGVAVANESGYHPLGKQFDSMDEAQRWADGLNAHIGIDERRAAEIIISTMRGLRVPD
jgi:hypothetical protein